MTRTTSLACVATLALLVGLARVSTAQAAGFVLFLYDKSSAADHRWIIRAAGSTSDTFVRFGAPTHTLIPGDYDGDGHLDLAVFTPNGGRWDVRSNSGVPFASVNFGESTDRPVPADYDGDRKTDYAVFRPSEGKWYVRPSAGGADIVTQFGEFGDVTVPGYYDGDRKTDYAVFRPLERKWYVRPSAGGADIVTQFGNAGDVAVPADYDGDRKTDYAVFRPSEGKWYVRPSAGGADIVTQFGQATDILAPNDYDGDGRADVSVFRPLEQRWYVHPSSGGADMVQVFNVNGDVTIPYSRLPPVIPGAPAERSKTQQLCATLLWPRGVVHYELDPSVGPNLQMIVKEAMSQWTSQSGGRITFEENAQATPRLRFKMQRNVQACGGYHPAASTIDCSYYDYGRGDADYAPRTSSQQATVSHEMGHGIGLFHEHLRYDRDRYVFVDDSSFNAGNYPDNWYTCGPNDAGTGFGPYDYATLMHYDSNPPYRIFYADGSEHTYEPSRQVARPSSTAYANADDGSDVAEQYAYEWGWKKYLSLGVDRGARVPLSPDLVPGVRANGAPSVASQGGRGKLDFVVRGTDNHMYHRFMSGGGWASGYVDLGGAPWGTEPATGSIGVGSVIVAAGKSRNIHVKEYAAGSWRSWIDLSGPTGTGTACSPPAVGSAGATNSRIYVRACNDAIYYRQRISLERWGPWTLSGRAPSEVAFTGKPAVAVRPGNNYEVFVAASGALYHQTNGGAFYRRAVGLLDGSSPSASASASGRVDVVFRDRENSSSRWMYVDAGAWNGPFPIGGLLTSDPTIVSGYVDHMDALAVLSDGRIWHRTFDRSRRSLHQDYAWDDRDEIVVFRPRDATWYFATLQHRPFGQDWFVESSKAFGVSTDRLVPADYDGDGYTDPAVYRPSEGKWYIRPASGGPDVVVQFGQASDVNVPSDYDGDGKADIAVFRPSNGTWFVRQSAGGGDRVVQFGQADDRLAPGDYDGDGKSDVALYRPSNATWYIHPTGGAPDKVVQFGVPTDRPVPGDYDGDGITDVAVFREAEGKWYIRPSGGGGDIVITFGVSTDRLVPADYDSDGKVDVAVFRPSEGKWYIHPSSGGADLVRQFGESSDVIPYSK